MFIHKLRKVHVSVSDYPWRFPDSTTDSNVVKWLYVPDFLTQPNPTFLICMSHTFFVVVLLTIVLLVSCIGGSFAQRELHCSPLLS